MTKYFIPPGDDYTPRVPDVEELLSYLVDRVREARDAGGPIFPLLFVGDQGVGKSRLLAALAVELRRAGFDVYYDLALPQAREEPYDYVILDDLAALVTSWEWLTKAGRTLKKIEILIRNLGRWGYAVAAPRAGDVIKNFREKSYMLLLVSRLQMRHEYGVETGCDVVALFAKPVTSLELTLYWQLRMVPRRGRRYCVKWGEFRWYGDAEWRREYERVQARREDLLRRWTEELEGEDEGVKLVRRAVALTGAGTPLEALKAILQAPGKFDVKFAIPRARHSDEDVRRRVEEALALIDDEEAASAVKRLLEEGRTRAVVFAKGVLFPGMPRKLLGAPMRKLKNTRGEWRYGYSIPLDKFIKLFTGN